MIEFRFRHESKCPQVSSEPRFSQMGSNGQRSNMCRGVMMKWDNEGPKSPRTWSSGNTVYVGLRTPVPLRAGVLEKLQEPCPPSSHFPAISAQLPIECCPDPAYCMVSTHSLFFY